MRVLVIEDDPFKAKRILKFLSHQLTIPAVESERSVTTGLARLVVDPMPDALLLDMSLSTYDVGARETGGRPQNFGGIAVLDHMVRRAIALPVAIITQFETFPRDGRELGLDDLRRELSIKYPSLFRELIYYNSRETRWEQEVESFLKSAGDW